MLKQITIAPERAVEFPRGLEWAFAAGAIGFLVMSVWFNREISLALAARHWPSVDGTIVRLETSSGTGGGGRMFPVYEYTVENAKYTGSGLGFGFPGVGYGDAFIKETKHLYRKGPAKVYYQKGNPARSALWNQSPGLITWLGSIGWPLACAGFTWVYFHIRRSRRSLTPSFPDS